MEERYLFFWGGEFSNWDYSPFVINTMTFNCVEQYMMFMKALVCGDDETAKKIMNEEEPINQKKLGRQIKNYKEEVWSAVRYDIVKEGIRQKFLQNPKHMAALKAHKGETIVEASPKDRIWGIGYHEGNAMKYKDNWGLNLLGKIITELSLELC